MVAPLIIPAIIGLLTGTSLPPAIVSIAGARAAATVISVDAVASKVYVDLPAICALTDGPLDRMTDLVDLGGSKFAAILDRLTRAADAACKASRQANTPINRLTLAIDVLDALVSAPPAAKPKGQ